MGQKSNLRTLQKLTPNFSILTLNHKKFIHGFNFFKYWNFLLYKKSILSVYQNIYFVENKLVLNCTFFFRTLKLKGYKKKILKTNDKSINTDSSRYKLFHKFCLKEFKVTGINVVVLKIIALNKFFCYKTLTSFLLKNKKFEKILFNRRLHLFIDFIKIQSLFIKNRVSTSSVLVILAQIFQVLPKQIHSRFLNFLKLNFKLIVIGLRSRIKGIKFVINGKIKGKTRSSSNIISFGKIPTQSISKIVDYSNIHVFTVYGVFGFKLWVYKV